LDSSGIRLSSPERRRYRRKYRAGGDSIMRNDLTVLKATGHLSIYQRTKPYQSGRKT
jgi:hypothetical protein